MVSNEKEPREERRSRYIETIKRQQVLDLIQPLERKLQAYKEGSISAEDLFKFLGSVHNQSEKIVKRFRNRPEVILAEISMEENRYTTEISEMNVKARLADITAIFADAIVNPADPRGTMTRGLAAAIKAAGGEVIEREAISKAPISVSKPIATCAGKLPNEYVIHVAVSEEASDKSSAELVCSATRSALSIAEQLKIESIAFPAMGSGVGGLTLKESAEAMIGALQEHKASSIKDISFVCKDSEAIDVFCSVLEKWDETHG